jgi:APA family basic amino acid/polyamine antiporter
VLVLAGTFDQIVSFFIAAALGFIAAAAAALFVVRRRNPTAASFRAPGYPLAPAVFVLLVLIVVLMVTMNRPAQALAGVALAAAGLFAYRIPRMRGRRSSE